jgi:Uma2 family endonuclease
MSTATHPDFLSLDNELFHLSMDQYHSMIDQGILGPEDHVEMLEGILVCKMSKNSAHRIGTRLLREALEAVIPAADWYVETQEPITLERSEPEPDIAVIRGRTTDYPAAHPKAADVMLVVEVADASLERDLDWKRRIYAEAGIPQYWVFDLRHRRIVTFSGPRNGVYTRERVFAETESVPLEWSGATLGLIAVAKALPA